LFIITSGFYTGPVCPAVGRTKDGNEPSAKIQCLNRLKNRTGAPDDINAGITFNDLYNSKDNPYLFNEKQGASITGYLVEAITSKGESCNCYTDDPDLRDIHIYLSPIPEIANKKDCIIVEITAVGKHNHVDWHLSYFNSLKGHKVKVTGYLLYDFEHRGNSYEYNPEGPHLWRRTSWEIHPVTQVQAVD
jgi:hypothetical protein